MFILYTLYRTGVEEEMFILYTLYRTGDEEEIRDDACDRVATSGFRVLAYRLDRQPAQRPRVYAAQVVQHPRPLGRRIAAHRAS